LHINTQKHQPTKAGRRPCVLDARNHYPQIKHHTPPPKQGDNQVLSPVSHTRDEEIAGLLPQSPIVCLAIHHRCLPHRLNVCCAPEPPPTTGRVHLTNRPGHRTPTHCGRAIGLVVLLRKEVIQPHLPVRLPCYDFVPIADPTFDGSLPKGLGHRLRVLPTFMT
jgi:hypothetical protein